MRLLVYLGTDREQTAPLPLAARRVHCMCAVSEEALCTS